MRSHLQNSTQQQLKNNQSRSDQNNSYQDLQAQQAVAPSSNAKNSQSRNVFFQQSNIKNNQDFMNSQKSKAQQQHQTVSFQNFQTKNQSNVSQKDLKEVKFKIQSLQQPTQQPAKQAGNLFQNQVKFQSKVNNRSVIALQNSKKQQIHTQQEQNQQYYKFSIPQQQLKINRKGGTQGVKINQCIQTQLYNEYNLNCQIKEAVLSKNLSYFFSQMSVYCEIKFHSSHIKIRSQNTNEQLSTIKDLLQTPYNDIEVDTEDDPIVTEKQTQIQTGQTPKWEEQFAFRFKKLSKACHKYLNKILYDGKTQYNGKQTETKIEQKDQDSAGLQNYKKLNQLIEQGTVTINQQADQKIEFILYNKTMLFINEKIGAVNLHIHNCYPGSKTNWLILTNDKDEEVGKLLVSIEIKRDNTQRQLRLIQKDLSMQDKVPTVDEPGVQGMNIDMTEDKGMPLRNHEQVLLLNEKKDKQQQNNTDHQNKSLQNNIVRSFNQNLINGTSQVVSQQTQETQITHVTHQTQNSAIIGSIGALQPQLRVEPHQSHHLKSINLSILTCLNQPSKGASIVGTINNIQKLKSSKLNVSQKTQKQSRITTNQITQSQIHQRNQRHLNPSSIILKNEKIDTSSQSHGLGGNPSAFGGFYLETTNIITTNKQEKKNSKKNGIGQRRAINEPGDFIEIVGNNQTVNHHEEESDEEEDDEDEDDEYDDEDDYDEEDNEYLDQNYQKLGDVQGKYVYQNQVYTKMNDNNHHENEAALATGGNLQTHCREEEDEEYEEECAGEEDDEIDSDEEGLNSLQLAFGQELAQQKRNSLNLIDQNNYFNKINSEQVKKTRELSKKSHNRFLVSTDSEPQIGQNQNYARISYVGNGSQKQNFRQTNKIGKPPKKDTNYKLTDGSYINLGQIETQQIHEEEDDYENETEFNQDSQPQNQKISKFKYQGFGQKIYKNEQNTAETPPVTILIENYIKNSKQIYRNKEIKDKLLNSQLLTNNLINEGGGVSHSTVGQNSNALNSISQNSKLNTKSMASQKSETNNNISNKNSNIKQTYSYKQVQTINLEQDSINLNQKSGKIIYLQKENNSQEVKKQKKGEIDKDDESNINSDEQDEYLECQVPLQKKKDLQSQGNLEIVQLQNQSVNVSGAGFQQSKNNLKQNLISQSTNSQNGAKWRQEEEQKQLVVHQQRPLTAQAQNQRTNYQTQNINQKQRQVQYIQLSNSQIAKVFQNNDQKNSTDGKFIQGVILLDQNGNDNSNQVQRNYTQQNFRTIQGQSSNRVPDNQKSNTQSGYIIEMNQQNSISPGNINFSNKAVKLNNFIAQSDNPENNFAAQNENNIEQYRFERENNNQLDEPSFRQSKSIFQKTIQQKAQGFTQQKDFQNYTRTDQLIQQNQQPQIKSKSQNRTVYKKQFIPQSNTPGIARSTLGLHTDND